MPRRRTRPGELAALGLLLAYLLWVPLPFGSTPDNFQPPFIVGGLLICAFAAMAAARSEAPLVFTRAHRTWTMGAVIFLLIVTLQLVVLPNGLLRLISPESARIWTRAESVGSLVLGPQAAAHSISIDPTTTALHLFRLLAYFAAFTTAALVVRRHAQRLAFAVVLSCSAIFQAGYGLREVVLHQFSIWGWKNTLIFNRASGTFVNPNHYADYAAMVAPLGFFILCLAWHDASPPQARTPYRFLRLFEKRFLPAAFGVITVVASIAAILVSKSRGALLALFAGAAVGLAVATGRRILRTLFCLAAGVAVVAAIALYLGRERTSITRFAPTEQEVQTLGGRRTGLETAMAIWRRFPLFGAGLGTFVDMAPMTQPADFDRVYNHAHNDYAEVAATTGALGIVTFVAALVTGLAFFIRRSFGAAAAATTFRRTAFQAAALASISVVLVHALVDFPFFIPANAATIAAIAGAAVATRSGSNGSRDFALDDSQV